MNSQPAPRLVRCEDCDEQFAVTEEQEVHRCEQCESSTRVDNTDELVCGSVTCTECEAINPGGTSYCAECGATLAASMAKPGSHAAKRLRQESAQALKSGYRGLSAVTLMYRLGAFAYAVATLLAVLALGRLDVPEQQGALVVLLTTSMSVLLLMAALHLQFKPFLWTIAVALLATSVSVVHVIGPDPLGVALLGSTAWALLAWAALIPTFRFRRLIATHKDQYILHHASAQTRRSLKGRTPHERHERLLRAMRRAARRTWRISSAAGLALMIASTLGSYAMLSNVRPEPLEPTRQSFESAWNHAQFEKIHELFDARVRATEQVYLHSRVAGYNWHSAPPQLGTAHVREGEDGLWMDYELDGLTVSALWKRIGPSWTLLHVEIPFPPLAPVFEEFQQAWNASNTQALVSFFAEDSRDAMQERIETSMRERSWEILPLPDNATLQDDGTGTANGFLRFGKKSLMSEWHLSNDGVWRLYGLTFPKRYKARKPEPAKTD